MSKSVVNTQISHLKKSGLVLSVTPWLFEELKGEKVEARYVGLKLENVWQEVFSLKNRLLLKLYLRQKKTYVEILLANSTPFVKIDSFELHSDTKIENVLGQLRNQLKKDKSDFLHHTDVLGNMYKKIEGKLFS